MRKSRSETIRERQRETTQQERVVEMWRSLRMRRRGGGGRFIQRPSDARGGKGGEGGGGGGGVGGKIHDE
jgi:hypothetical protein